METIETMTAEYTAWLKARPWYKEMSADELESEIIGNEVDWPKDGNEAAHADVEWLRDYQERWETLFERRSLSLDGQERALIAEALELLALAPAEPRVADITALAQRIKAGS